MSTAAIVGVDLGGTNLRVGRVVDGEVTLHLSAPVSSNASEEVVLEEIERAIDQVVGREAIAIGVGVPSVVDVERGVVYAVQNIPSWKEVRLKERLERRFGVPAHVNNDANCFALGEFRFGKGRGSRHMVGLTVGTGLGAGIIIDGRLYSGSNCGAGEIGTIPYRELTIEHYCSGPFFTREFGVAGDVLFERAQAGDAVALRAFRAFGFEMGHALMAVLYAYDPEIVVFGGSVSRALPFFEGAMREKLKSFAYQHALERLVIERSELPHVPILGAAALHLDATEGRR